MVPPSAPVVPCDEDNAVGPEPAFYYCIDLGDGPLHSNGHPPHARSGTAGNVTVGMQWTVAQVNAIVKGGLWPNSVIFITWDDWGGWWDHVDPPNVETWNKPTPLPSYNKTQFRYGSRVGCLVLSPYAKTNYISKQFHSHISLVKFCETLHGLAPLNARDQKSDDMSDCFDFNQQPAPPPPTKP